MWSQPSIRETWRVFTRTKSPRPYPASSPFATCGKSLRGWTCFVHPEASACLNCAEAESSVKPPTPPPHLPILPFNTFHILYFRISSIHVTLVSIFVHLCSYVTLAHAHH